MLQYRLKFFQQVIGHNYKHLQNLRGNKCIDKDQNILLIKILSNCIEITNMKITGISYAFGCRDLQMTRKNPRKCSDLSLIPQAANK